MAAKPGPVTKRARSPDFSKPPVKPETWKTVELPDSDWVPPMREACTASIVHEQLFLFGGIGCGGSGRYNAVVTFDPVSKSWCNFPCTGPAPAPRARHTTTVLNKHLFVYGGESVFRVDDATAAGRTSEKSSKVEGRELYNDSFLLNTETAEWARVTPDNINAASKRCGHTAVLQMQRNGTPRVVVFGGVGPNPDHTAMVGRNDVVCYDIKDSRWYAQETTGMPPPGRDSHVAVLIDNRMWVHGGKDENSLLEDLFCLNVDTHEWTEVFTSSTVPRGYGHTAALNPWFGNKFYIFGGRCYDDEPDSALYSFDTNTREFSVVGTGTAPEPRYSHCMVSFHRPEEDIAYEVWETQQLAAAEASAAAADAAAAAGAGGNSKARARGGTKQGAGARGAAAGGAATGATTDAAARRTSVPHKAGVHRRTSVVSVVSVTRFRHARGVDEAGAGDDAARQAPRQILVFGGAVTRGGGFCDPHKLSCVLSYPPPLKPKRNSAVASDKSSMLQPTPMPAGPGSGSLRLPGSRNASRPTSRAATPAGAGRAHTFSMDDASGRGMGAGAGAGAGAGIRFAADVGGDGATHSSERTSALLRELPQTPSSYADFLEIDRARQEVMRQRAARRRSSRRSTSGGSPLARANGSPQRLASSHNNNNNNNLSNNLSNNNNLSNSQPRGASHSAPVVPAGWDGSLFAPPSPTQHSRANGTRAGTSSASGGIWGQQPGSRPNSSSGHFDSLGALEDVRRRALATAPGRMRQLDTDWFDAQVAALKSPMPPSRWDPRFDADGSQSPQRASQRSTIRSVADALGINFDRVPPRTAPSGSGGMGGRARGRARAKARATAGLGASASSGALPATLSDTADAPVDAAAAAAAAAAAGPRVAGDATYVTFGIMKEIALRDTSASPTVEEMARRRAQQAAALRQRGGKRRGARKAQLRLSTGSGSRGKVPPGSVAPSDLKVMRSPSLRTLGSRFRDRPVVKKYGPLVESRTLPQLPVRLVRLFPGSAGNTDGASGAARRDGRFGVETDVTRSPPPVRAQNLLFSPVSYGR